MNQAKLSSALASDYYQTNKSKKHENLISILNF